MVIFGPVTIPFVRMSLLDSAFFSAFFGAIAGASAAAWLAWWTAKRQRLREEILACNVAISICSSIVNAFVAIKKQSIQPLVERYEIEKGRLFLLSVIAATGGKGSFTLRFDLQNTQNVWGS